MSHLAKPFAAEAANRTASSAHAEALRGGGREQNRIQRTCRSPSRRRPRTEPQPAHMPKLFAAEAANSMEPRGVEPLCRDARNEGFYACIQLFHLESRVSRWTLRGIPDRQDVAGNRLSGFTHQPDVYGHSRHQASHGVHAAKLGRESVLRVGRRFCAYFLRGQQAPRRATFVRLRPVDAGTAPVVTERAHCRPPPCSRETGLTSPPPRPHAGG